MLLNDFKNTVDRYSATISCPNDLSEAYKLLNLDASRGCGRDPVTKKLNENIKEALRLDNSGPEKVSKIGLLNLQTELINRYVRCDENPVEYLNILRHIADLFRHDADDFPPFSETGKWEKAIINCKNFNKFSTSTHLISLKDIRRASPKDFDIATSVKELEKMGCKIVLKGPDICVASGFEKVLYELDEKVKTIGGITLAQSLFNHLSKCGKYSTRFERYFITHEAHPFNFEQRPQIPFGFLFNLSVKYPYENLELENSQALLSEIIDLATIISNSYGVQPYNSLAFHFQSGDTMIQFLRDTALWDTIFAIPQCRPSVALDIADNLFSFIDDSCFQSDFGFSKQELSLVSNTIHSIASDHPHFPAIIYHPALSEKLRQVDKNRIQKILDFLSHQTPVNKDYTLVNKDYILTSDYCSIDFFQKPLIKLGATKFLLMNKSWCSPNYFEAVALNLRRLYPDIDTKIGYELEKFLQNKLTEKGISFSTGKYKVDGEEGECDLLIESEEAIVLIECKKKCLTRKAKSGSDIPILINLSKSLLDAQIQAGRTEIILKEKGSITLKAKDGNTKTVNTNDKHIERVALTLHEFG